MSKSRIEELFLDLGQSIINLVNSRFTTLDNKYSRDTQLRFDYFESRIYSMLSNLEARINKIGSRNVGEILMSPIPLVDTRLHLLDGSVIQREGIYINFVDYVKSLRTSHPNMFTTLSAYNSCVSSYGVCGKFVYDDTNNSVKLPTVTGILSGTNVENDLCTLIEAGLPNITGCFPGSETVYRANKSGSQHTSDLSKVKDSDGKAVSLPSNYGSFYKIASNIVSGNAVNDKFDNDFYGFSASKSSSIYGKSTTVQPQTIKVHYYIVVAPTESGLNVDDLALDSADFEREVYREKGKDLNDIKDLLLQHLQLDEKKLAIELRANTFYRGAIIGDKRLFDEIGRILGYSPEQMDYLFLNKHFPI